MTCSYSWNMSLYLMLCYIYSSISVRHLNENSFNENLLFWSNKCCVNALGQSVIYMRHAHYHHWFKKYFEACCNQTNSWTNVNFITLNINHTLRGLCLTQFSQNETVNNNSPFHTEKSGILISFPLWNIDFAMLTCTFDSGMLGWESKALSHQSVQLSDVLNEGGD